jgi:NADH-quinone oxidoreductase subunit C
MEYGDTTALITALQEAVPSATLEAAEGVDRQPALYVSRDHLADALRALRGDLTFAVLIELTAVDFWPREPRFEVIYSLLSIERRQRARVKVRLNADAPRLPTMSAVWPAANWLEREVWDLFGIEFDGHPDPRRLLMPEDWEGYPLRKDYPVQIDLKARTTEPMQVSEEEFRASLLKDRLVRQP